MCRRDLNVMENLMGSAEFLTVFAVSGGVAFIAVQAHKRLLSDFMDKIHFQFDGRRRRCDQVKKRVRFADDVKESSSDNKDYRRKNNGVARKSHHDGDQMPMNRQVLYSGIIKYRMLSTQQG